MKNAILLHGTGGHSQNFWFPWLQGKLEKLGYSVWAPTLPSAARPTLTEILPFLLANAEVTESTALIAHSAGCPAALALLEEIDTTIDRCCLVAGFYHPIERVPDAPFILKERYDWEKIKKRAREIVLINSDNDPWGCTDAHAKPTGAALEATMVVPFGEGHMGSTTYGQPYTKFPFLCRLLGISD